MAQVISCAENGPVVLRRARWTRDGAGRVQPVPESWDTVPESPRAFALVACPKCGKPNVLTHVTHRVDEIGKVSPRFDCAECGFKRDVYLDRWDKQKPLYAIAIERISKSGAVKAEIHYAHARNEHEARFHLGAGNYRVVAIGPVIAYHSEDEHGEVALA